MLVQQVLINLLENAVKYSDPESPLEIRAKGSKLTVEISIADRGRGLPEGEETKIFEKFYRAEKGKGGGAGLGLTICRAIVMAHGGRIWAERRENGGSIFRFTLPASGPTARPRRNTSGVGEPKFDAIVRPAERPGMKEAEFRPTELS